LLICFVKIFNNIQEFDHSTQRLFTWVLTQAKTTINEICAEEKKSLKIQTIINYVQQNRDLSNPVFINLLILHGVSLNELAVLSGVTKQELLDLVRNNINQKKK